MKLKTEPREIDLYVESKRLTQKEMKELADFIKAYKEKKKSRSRKISKAA